jgi:hypothetical protein
MGNIQSINKVNFEFIQNIINDSSFILINTLDNTNQKCLIKNTLHINDEITIIDNYIKCKKNVKKIVIYGKNCTDESIYIKYKQLISLGLNGNNIYIYIGGIFEWLLLQDIYGKCDFLTSSDELDILKYK